MSISIEYRGFKIGFSENQSLWRCWDMEAEDMDLTKVKAKIDRVLLKTRKENATPALMLDLADWGGKSRSKLIEVTVMEYMGPKMEKKGPFGTGEQYVADHRVGVVATRRYQERASKRTELLSSIIKPGPEAESIVARMNEIEEQLHRLSDEKLALKKSLPLLTVEDIAALVKIADTQSADD